jgi:hypothetical protein
VERSHLQTVFEIQTHEPSHAMSDWKFLNQHRCRVAIPGRVPWMYCSGVEDGFNGMFRIPIGGKLVRCIASDGEGWQHVSVSIERDHRTPPWGVMCQIKDWFFEPDQWVVQFHPAQKDYVNYHPGCLHLWRCTDGREMPTPPHILVGPK